MKIRIKALQPTVVLYLLVSLFPIYGQVNIQFPQTRLVFQRNTDGTAKVYITGSYSGSVDKIEARLVARNGEPGTAINWTEIVGNPSGNVYSGFLTATGGRYDLEVRAMKNNSQVGATETVPKVGVGEVFLIVGHSNASMAGSYSDLLGASSDLVNSIDPNTNRPLFDQYLINGTPTYMAPLTPTPLCQTCGIAPMNLEPWFWSRLGDLLVSPSALNVPVLFYSAAFGGSNMDQTYMAAYDIPFTHGFIRYNIRMPYANIRNVLQAYVPVTGLRAILSAHGINDAGNSGDHFKFISEKVIEKTRAEANYPDLAWLIATSAYNNGIRADLTAAQESLISTVANVFRGANLNSIGSEGRYDGLHFSNAGQTMAATLWRDAIVTPNVLQNAKSLMAQPPAPPTPMPVILTYFNGKTEVNGKNRLTWTTSTEVDNDYFEIQKSADAIQFVTIGKVKGQGDSKQKQSYTFVDEQPSPHFNYYRLKQVDSNGTFNLSTIINIRKAMPETDTYIYPNPAQHVIDIATNPGFRVASLRLFDLQGKERKQNKNSSQMDLTGLPQGEYYLQIDMTDGGSVRKKISKLE